MLRSQYWSGIYSDKFRNALRHHFDDGADSESLLKYAHTAEQEPSSAVAQQSVAGTQPDKLDQILAQLKDFNVRVQELERKCSYGDSPLPMGVQHPTAPVSATVVPPVVSSGPGVIPLVGPSSEVEVKVEGKSCQTLLDTGAMVSTLTLSLCQQLKLPLHPMSQIVRVEGVGGHSLKY